MGMVLVLVCAAVGALGIDVLGRAIKAGIAAEAVASVGDRARAAARLPRAGLLDPHAHARRRGALGRLRRRRHARRARGRRLGLHRLRRLRGRLGGDARRGAPRPAGDLDRAAQRRRARDPQRGRGHARPPRSRPPSSPGATSTRSSTAVASSFGSWSDKPFAAVVLVGVPRLRDGGPGADRADDLLGRPRRRAARRRASCAGSTAAARRSGRSSSPRSIACLGLLLGLNTAAVGSLIAFGTAAIYVAFLLVALAALIARLRGTWVPAGTSGSAAPASRQRARRRLARVRDRQHRLAAHVARAAGRARLPGLGGPDRARGDRRRRACVPAVAKPHRKLAGR